MYGIRLIHGDCLDAVGDFTCDAVVTDPPYCLVNQFTDLQKPPGKGSRRLSWDYDTEADPAAVWERLSAAFHRAAGGIFCFAGSDYFSPWLCGARSLGFTVKPAAWVKKCPPPAGKGNWWPSGFELAFYGYRPGAWFGDTDKKRSNVFHADSYRYGQPGKCGHPAQKPLSMVERIVTAICPPGGTVFDPFMGSGTTALACARTGRNFVGCEIRPDYFAMAQGRIAAQAAAPPLLIA